MIKRHFLYGVVVNAACMLWACVSANAADITIMFTGETHAMLYPCVCPVEPDGGVARMATLVKEVRAQHAGALLVDSGGFFAGGSLDEYSQNVPFDNFRTQVQLSAMKAMGYDAVAVGDEEFGFGKEFFMQKSSEAGFPFLSCNADASGVVPFVVRESGGVKVGIIGLSPWEAAVKAVGITVSDPRASLPGTIQKARAAGAQVILVLSHAGEAEDRALLKSIPGIDILVTGHAFGRNALAEKVGSAQLVFPSWQGKKLGVLTVPYADARVGECRVQQVRLADTVKDDPQVAQLLPKCFSDGNCKQRGARGNCENPGTMQSSCKFIEAAPVSLMVITSTDCIACNPEPLIQAMIRSFPGIKTERLQYPDKSAVELLDTLSINTLPAFILGPEIAHEKNFKDYEGAMEKKGGRYVVKPEVSGAAYYFRRPVRAGSFEVFLSLFGEDAEKHIGALRQDAPKVHFLAKAVNNGFDAVGGAPEIEEYLRSVCIEKLYPARLWEYLQCRVRDVHSSWWDSCTAGMNNASIKACALSPQGKQLLRENTALNDDLKVMTGPTYLLDNQQIFGSKGVLSKEEIATLRKKK